MIRCGEQLTEEGDAGCGGGWRRGFHEYNRAAHFQNATKVKMLKKVLTVETSTLHVGGHLWLRVHKLRPPDVQTFFS